MKRLRLATLALLTQLACPAMAEPSAGLQTSGYDAQVRVQDDLFRAVNGGWIQSTEIPADKAEYGTFIQLRDLSDQRVREIVEGLARQRLQPGSVAQKVGAFYGAYVDTAAIDKAVSTYLDGLKGQPEVFYERNTRSLAKTGAALARWAKAEKQDALLKQFRSRLQGVCDTLPAGDAQRKTCEGVWAGKA